MTGRKCETTNYYAEITYTVSQKTSHLCIVITLTYVNGFLIFFAQILPIK